MANYLEVKAAAGKYESNGQEKTRWTKVGVAFPSEKLGGYSVKLDLPVGATEFILVPPRPKEDVAF